MSNRDLATPELSLPLLLTTLAGVYTLQSVIGMFSLQGIPAVLRAEGVSTAQIGMLYLAMLPWALKFLWAPRVERFRHAGPGLRNHGLLLMFPQWLIALGMLGLLMTPLLSEVTVLFCGLIVIAMISTVTDIAADGLAVDQLPDSKRSLGNVMQVGGAYLGTIIGSGLFIYISGTWGWQYGVGILIAVLMLLPGFFWLLVRRQGARPVVNGTSPSLLQVWRNPVMRKGILWVVVCQAGTRCVLAMLFPFMIDQGMQLADLGILAAGGGALASLGGVLLAGFLLQRISFLWMLAVFLVAEFFCYLGLYLLTTGWQPGAGSLAVMFVLVSAVSAGKFVALFSLMMDWSYGSQAGVDFTVLQSADMSVAIIFALLGGWLVSGYGYNVLFAVAVIATAVAGVTVFRSVRRHYACCHMWSGNA
ncbi:MFS transporter [Aliamphritea hakodatensis]|uniref:MFS transporter n=1 Tax=Aliamphritea hakodatensis TaxID=2895352 RepID=UPI0022FD7A18|nr:MFS transporter [Aliamphritea hakodatensis]